MTISTKQNLSRKRKFRSRFNDQNWDEVLKFIQSHLQANEKLLLPDEFCDALFKDTYSVYSYAQFLEEDQFNWILLHKGRLESLPLDFLEKIWFSSVPVFANSVFVLFSQSKQNSVVNYHSNHLRSLWFLLLKRKQNQVLNHFQDKVTSFKRKILTEPSFSFLGDRSNSQPRPILGQHQSTIPLTWAATSREQPFANLGDALSPIMVAALSGLPVTHHSFSSWRTRLACVGTIAHGLKCGTVHLWGTGIDHRKHPINPYFNFYEKPLNTKFHIHALRGPFSAQTFRKQGVHVPNVYGDPIWFLPTIIEPTEKQYDLGVIVHLSELENLSDTSIVKKTILRYKIPESLASKIKIITTMTQPTFAALEAKVQEITACKRIASTSLHGLV
ncbi:MAG: hypothetical protein SFY66_19980, partial [Oculatellaceae cyanobacterium bins.114]|nr:hypothetical protein [Oculatellaceae cyanobacterium bins.114]